MPDLLVLNLKIERSVVYNFVCIFKDSSIGALKITYGHHLWSQESPSCVRKGISGTFLIRQSFDIHKDILFQILYIFKGKSNAGVNFSEEYHSPLAKKNPDHFPSGTFLIHYFNLPDISNAYTFNSRNAIFLIERQIFSWRKYCK